MVERLPVVGRFFTPEPVDEQLTRQARARLEDAKRNCDVCRANLSFISSCDESAFTNAFQELVAANRELSLAYCGLSRMAGRPICAGEGKPFRFRGNRIVKKLLEQTKREEPEYER